ncbi:MAG: cytochrome c4 [Acidiferrobacterales bacterium]|nr:cytochrome c4 [Acidiferrobacterales bacterium]
MLKKVVKIAAGLVLVTVAVASNSYAAGDAAAGQEKSAVCAACHGPQGVSSIPLNANIAGQVPGYIETQLKAFKSGERVNVLMAGQASILSDQDMADLDAYYSSLPAATNGSLTDEQKTLAEAGEAIYRGGFAERGIAACMGCHGPSGHGIPKNYPRVSAQHFEYLEQQLLMYKKGERVGYNGVMWDIAFGLSELQIKQLSAYMAGLN